MNKWTVRSMVSVLAAVCLIGSVAVQPARVDAASLAAQQVVERTQNGGLPSDFPIPDDATVVTAARSDNNQEHFVRLTLRTMLSMELLAKTYSEYFRSVDMPDAIKKISEEGLLIQGDNAQTGESWILIANPVDPSATNGEVQMTLVWNDAR
ncbi:hypothetical protein [Paenibacillus hunanensis]|uniref:Uncharacterized protein n=1 Tax=Paenibacillus hunanensis TaxID=539262 RepID=A0ABU1ITY7_9BACL|nr:hypothetical protein [Paenibacillus hunanensis]MDR6242729.1 hypothetical protein [Paenibacillus hunanensis]GGJ02279.1 hypothetical protein GCM10008022_09060 [Paenibacillus hunanensis]